VQAAGYTPLHTACSYNFWRCVQVLLVVGCDVNAQSVGAAGDPCFVCCASPLLVYSFGMLHQITQCASLTDTNNRGTGFHR
jgi:ankyrin repeat protein